MFRVGSSITAYAPDYKFLRVCWAIKYVGVISVKAAFKLNDGNTTCRHDNCIVVSIGISRRNPFANKATILHVLEYLSHKLPLLNHCRGILAPDAFDSTAKKTALIKIMCRKAMIAEGVRLCF